MKTIKTIDVIAKEWFDKRNGNSYFSARVCTNFDMKDQLTFSVPFQYGYGDFYLQAAHAELIERGILPDTDMSLSRYCGENDITLRYTKHENCLKGDVIMYGE